MNERGLVVVTGASRGIGLGISRRLVSDGYSVLGISRDPARLQKVASELGEGFLYEAADIADAASAHAAIQRAALSHRLVGLVNNAGVSHLGASDEMEPGQFESIMTTNVTAVFSYCVEAYRVFREQDSGGSIVNLTSIDAYVGHGKMAAYSASKFAVRGLTKSLAIEWARYEIRVNSVAPGAISTEMTEHLVVGSKGYEHVMAKTPLRRFGEAAEVAGAVALLIGPDSTYITGANIAVDGGYTA